MKHISRPSGIDIATLLGVAIIWGSAFPAIKVIVPELGAFWAAALRVLVGFLVVLPFCLLIKARPNFRGQWGRIALIAALNMVIPFILISWAMFYVEAGVGSLLLATTPFIAMVLGHFLTVDERITPQKAVGVLFAMSGVAVLVGPDAFSGLGSEFFLAKLAIVLAGVCYVMAGFQMRKIEMEAIPFTAAALGAGSIMLVALSFAFAGPLPVMPSGQTLWVLLWLGVMPTGLAYLLRYRLVQRVGVSLFALSMNAVPVFGIIIAALTLGETIRGTTILALVLVLAGLMIARRKRLLSAAGGRG